MNKRLVLVGVMSILCSYPAFSASMQSPRQQYYKSVVAQINAATDEEAALAVFVQFLEKSKLRKDGTPTNPQDRQAFLDQILPAISAKLSAETLASLESAQPKVNAQDIGKNPVYQKLVKTRLYKGAVENVTPQELKETKQELEEIVEGIEGGDIKASEADKKKIADLEGKVKSLEESLATALANQILPPPFAPSANLTDVNTAFAGKLKDYANKLKAAGKTAELKALQEAVNIK